MTDNRSAASRLRSSHQPVVGDLVGTVKDRPPSFSHDVFLPISIRSTSDDARVILVSPHTGHGLRATRPTPGTPFAWVRKTVPHTHVQVISGNLSNTDQSIVLTPASNVAREHRRPSRWRHELPCPDQKPTPRSAYTRGLRFPPDL